MTNSDRCRFCGAALKCTFLDLGATPLANSFLKPDQLSCVEPFYPLHVFVCETCMLVQIKEYSSPHELFNDYAYFSSYSQEWLCHARAYTDMIIRRFNFDKTSHVVEIASNDGYLLQYFLERGIPSLGIEPAENTAKAAQEKGISTIVAFFGEKAAQDLCNAGKQADLLIGNNVLAHVPGLNDFLGGLKILLKRQGIITVEIPHLLRLIEYNQFDTIYHEHFSYFSFIVVERVFRAHGLSVFDVEELNTHGGSLRVYACHQEDASKTVSDRVLELKSREEAAGLTQLNPYLSFSEKVAHTKRQLLSFLISAKEEGKTIVGYGAPAKGNTLLNYCGIGADFIDYTVDRSPHKQGKFLPGTRIPIYHVDRIKETHPDYLFILPWNLKDEIIGSTDYIRSWGGRFVIPIPQVTIC